MNNNRNIILGKLGKLDYLDKEELFKLSIVGCDKAIELDPKDFHSYHIKGISLYNLNKHNLALDAFDKAIELNPNDPNFYFDKSLALYCLGKYDEALEALNKALKLNPNYANAQEMKQKLLKEIAK